LPLLLEALERLPCDSPVLGHRLSLGAQFCD